MSQALLAHVSNASVKKNVTVLRPGYVVRVHQRIVEGEKERVQIFEGLVIKLSSGAHAVDKTFTVRKVVEGVGVEKVFPFHSPIIEKVEVIKTGKVRRSKLYYMRGLQGKSARLQDKHGEVIAMMMAPVTTGPVLEEPKAEESAVEETVVAQEVAAEETQVEAVLNQDEGDQSTQTDQDQEKQE